MFKGLKQNLKHNIYRTESVPVVMQKSRGNTSTVGPSRLRGL